MGKTINGIPEKNYYLIKEMILHSGPVGVYQMVLNRELEKFPQGFWSMPENYDYSRECNKYLIEGILKWNREDICKKLNTNTYIKYKLRGAIKIFNDSIYRTLENTYPKEFKPWELNTCMKNYWNSETAGEATRWLIEEKLKWSKQEVYEKIRKETFIENGLAGMISVVFNNRLQNCLENAYPKDFNVLEMYRVSRNYWSLQTAKEATKWVIEEKLGWKIEDIIVKYNDRTLRDNGLDSMLQIMFNGSSYKALKNAYPNEYEIIVKSKIANGSNINNVSKI